MKLRLLVFFIVYVCFVALVPVFCDEQFPEEPYLEPQPGDDIVITADIGITVGDLRYYIFVEDLYFRCRLSYVEMCNLYWKAEADNEELVGENTELDLRVKELTKQRNIMIGVASGVVLVSGIIVYLVLK
jgi:hypothetical protein